MAKICVQELVSVSQPGSLSGEEWRPIKGHPYYEASNFGRIRSLDHMTEKTDGYSYYYKGRVLEQGVHRGYPVVALGTSDKYRVHLLVCEAIHGPKPSPKYEACHLDGNKLNCRADNLCWKTRKETIDNEIANTGKHWSAKRLTPEDVAEICRLRVEGMSGKEVAAQFNISAPMISLIINGKSWAHLKDATEPFREQEFQLREKDRDLNGEEWRPIEENPYYEGSNFGRIRSLSRLVDCGRGGMRRWRGRIISPGKDGNGYFKVDIGKDRTRLVHILICIAFHGPKPSSDHWVAHNDDNKTNNHIDNLRWALPAENTADHMRFGRMPKGESHALAKITEEDVRAIRILFEEGVNRSRIATRFGVSRNRVYLVATRRTWAHVK